MTLLLIRTLSLWPGPQLMVNSVLGLSLSLSVSNNQTRFIVIISPFLARHMSFVSRKFDNNLVSRTKRIVSLFTGWLYNVLVMLILR